MKHKHYEMIVAKAANMDLVVFRKGINGGCEWYEAGDSQCWQENANYFLCLPQHNESGQCLHWLNGGEVQTRRGCSDLGWDTLLPFEGEWNKVSHFMCVDILLRIKPKKQKCWILVNSKTGRTSELFYDESSAIRELSEEDFNWSKHEIEVEV